MNYTETKKQINAIRNKNEVMFRMAISHLMDVGIRNLTEKSVAETCAEIMKEDDSRSFMTNEYKCALVKTAGELAKLDHIHVLTYISREVTYDVGDNAIDYKQAMELLMNCLDYCGASTYETMYALEMAREMGFDDEEIEQLGYGYMLDVEEEDE